MNQLESGNTYSLQELFSGNRKIIIPDMQRDYTWGDDNTKEILVKNFCQNLLELSSLEKSIAIGMIYAYPNPENHYHLIDGQQRITTLFLLMGMLYKHTQLEELKERLISKFELEEDDQEPYLQYAIRESSLYFLSDLVVKFFLVDQGNAEKVKEIKSESWYFSEYNHDSSIQSMLGALEVIEEIIKNKDNLEGFSKWLIEKVTFFYFDMENREHGEEMFVVINTTGEPLEVTEELKPLLIGDIPCEQTRKKLSEQWEERETFFWENRKSSEHISDEGLKEFLTWYIRIKNKTESIDLTKYFKESNKENELKKLHSFFISFQETLELIDKDLDLKRLFAEDNKGNAIFVLSRVRELSVRLNNMFLPFWYFNHRFGGSAEFSIKEKFLRRLRKNQFDQKWQRGGYVDWRYILQIIEKSDNPDEVLTFDKELKPITNVKVATWYTEEEQIKDQLRSENPEHDQILKEWEDYPDFMGDLSILLQAYLLKEGDSKTPDITVEEKYDFDELSRIMKNYKAVIDPLRTREIKDNALFNIFRLFRVYAFINKIDNIKKTNGIVGVLFSTFNRNHLKNTNFLKVLHAKNSFSFCQCFIKNELTLSDFSNISEKSEVKNFVKIWLTLKVFSSIKNNDILDIDEASGIAAYADITKNKIYDNFKFGIENSTCGFSITSGWGYKSYVLYPKDENKWRSPSKYIHVPFAGVDINGFKNSEANIIDGATALAENKKAIDGIIEFIFQ